MTDWPYRIDEVNGSSFPYKSLDRALASFYRYAFKNYWPVLLKDEKTGVILLAARKGKLLRPGELHDLCLDKMEFAAQTEVEQPGVWTFPERTYSAMKLTIARLEQFAALEAQ